MYHRSLASTLKHCTFFTTILVLFSSCWRSETPQSFIRPVKVQQALALNYYQKDFIGTVWAAQYTNLAFQVGGVIKKINFDEGSSVKKGQVLAEIEPQDFSLEMEANKAQYLSSKSILERNERLLNKQAISRQDEEIARANFEKSKSAYEYSINQLGYTQLKAPFDGSIEIKYVEDFQKVSPGEKIFKLINPSVLEVRFTLPESNTNMHNVNAQFHVEFDNLKGQSFKAKIKDMVDASVSGMGIPVTLSITDPKFNPIKQNIKAGFACKVNITVENESNLKDYMRIPITAIFKLNTSGSDRYVWVYDEKTSSVKKRKVITNGLTGNSEIIVSKGLTTGEMVVVAGVYQITENQKVSILK